MDDPLTEIDALKRGANECRQVEIGGYTVQGCSSVECGCCLTR
jgi:hypothetical protein